MDQKYLKLSGLILFSISYALIATSRLYSGVPPSLNIQGRLTDEKGVNRDGNFAMVFTLYDQPAGGTEKWRRSYLGVQVRNGNFQISLGSPDGKDDTNRDLSAIFDGSNRWLGITVVGEPELIPRQQLVTVPHAFVADRLATPTVPIGTILDWYRPTATTPVPDGFKICDGSLITDPASPFNGQNAPNLIDRFTYGVDSSRIGQSGGQIDANNPSVNLAHDHTYTDVPSHTHTINDPGHSHTMDNLIIFQ